MRSFFSTSNLRALSYVQCFVCSSFRSENDSECTNKCTEDAARGHGPHGLRSLCGLSPRSAIIHGGTAQQMRAQLAIKYLE